MSRKIEDLDVRFQPIVRQLLDESNKLTSPWLTFITDGFRTYAEQAEMYASGRTKIGKILTNAKPGTSNHEKGLAVDLAFQKDGKLSYDVNLYGKIVPIAKKLGITWGGDWTGFPDKPHFEKLKFDSGGTIIEDVITPQTKIPQVIDQNGNAMEVQAIVSSMRAKDDKIVSLGITVTALNTRITTLDALVGSPQTSPEPPGTELPPIVDTSTTPGSFNKFLTWIKGFFH